MNSRQWTCQSSESLQKTEKEDIAYHLVDHHFSSVRYAHKLLLASKDLL